MTEEISLETKKTAASLAWLIAVSLLFIWLGAKNAAVGGYAVMFDKTEFVSIREAVMSLSVKCAADIAMILAVTLVSKPVVSLAVASAVLGGRGVALGICVAFCAKNAVDTSAVAMVVSFAMVSVLIALYTVLINRIRAGAAVRIGLYLLTTGAASMLRLLPVMLT